MSIISDLFEINKRLSYELWHLKNTGEEINELSPNLILPFKRDTKNIRLCEQEAKVIYCNILDRLNYFYSIETPTNNLYQQRGKTSRSANIDISLFTELFSKEKRRIKRVANVELKAHNPSQFSYQKDIEKLIRESIPGSWVQVIDGFQNHKSDYFDKLTKKLMDSFINLKKDAIKAQKISMVFYFHSLDERWSSIKHFKFDFQQKNNYKEYVEKFFDMNFELKEYKDENVKYSYINCKNNNGWHTFSMKNFHEEIK